jgi:uncharacterized protein YeaO (DUF488 family)
MVQIKRVYDPVLKEDGARFLVERLWPRGIKKEALHMAGWCKDAAPSPDLRRWFGHDPAKWEEFKKRYRAELAKNPLTWLPLVEAARSGNLTLLYSARDPEHNSAAILKSYIEGAMAENRDTMTRS